MAAHSEALRPESESIQQLLSQIEIFSCAIAEMDQPSKATCVLIEELDRINAAISALERLPEPIVKSSAIQRALGKLLNQSGWYDQQGINHLMLFAPLKKEKGRPVEIGKVITIGLCVECLCEYTNSIELPASSDIIGLARWAWFVVTKEQASTEAWRQIVIQWKSMAPRLGENQP